MPLGHRINKKHLSVIKLYLIIYYGTSLYFLLINYKMEHFVLVTYCSISEYYFLNSLISHEKNTYESFCNHSRNFAKVNSRI